MSRSHFTFASGSVGLDSFLDDEYGGDDGRKFVLCEGQLAVGPKRMDDPELVHEDLTLGLEQRAGRSLARTELILGWLWITPGQDPKYSLAYEEPSAHIERALAQWLRDEADESVGSGP